VDVKIIINILGRRLGRSKAAIKKRISLAKSEPAFFHRDLCKKAVIFSERDLRKKKIKL
jgi:hypothetical protein